VRIDKLTKFTSHGHGDANPPTTDLAKELGELDSPKIGST
jgi:hypothetical protein